MLGVAALRDRSLRGIANLEQTQMLEPALDPRELREVPVLQHLGIACGERRAAEVDFVKGALDVVEQRDEHRVGAARVGKRLQPCVDSLFCVRVRDALKINRDFRADQVESGLARTHRAARGTGDSGVDCDVDDLPTSTLFHPRNHDDRATP